MKKNPKSQSRPRAKTQAPLEPAYFLEDAKEHFHRLVAKPWGKAVVAAIALLIAVWSFGTVRAHLRLTQAENQIKKGFSALAAETLDPVRTDLTSNTRGCAALVAAYYGAHQPDRLEWAAQACITAGIETTDTYIALAAARELTGRDADALQFLEQITHKFDKSPDPYYRIAEILRRNKKNGEAADALLKAVERAPNNNQLIMETMTQLTLADRFPEARKLADRIKGVDTDNPEIKLLIARALIKGGDLDGGRTVITQARALMDKKPEMRAALEHAYSDILDAKLAQDDAGSDTGKPEANRSPASRKQSPSPATPPRKF